jgi:hypothetical protein
MQVHFSKPKQDTYGKRKEKLQQDASVMAVVMVAAMIVVADNLIKYNLKRCC